MLAIGSHCSSTSTTYNTLLRELQQIWTDIGESEGEKHRMLLELDRECLKVYQRKVDESANTKARLHQSIAAKEAELATLMAALGERQINSPLEKRVMPLKEQLASITPLVEDLKLEKEERLKQFTDVKTQIEKISSEISGYGKVITAMSSLNLEENDLSLRKLSEYQTHLRSLQNEKSQRVQKILEFVNEVHSLCAVLGVDFGKTVSEVHPSLQETGVGQSMNISDSTLQGLNQVILRLKTERKVRFQKLKDVSASLFELWNLMDTTREEKFSFLRVTSILGSPESEIFEHDALSLEIIQQVSSEVERLTKLKASRMKELVMKKRSELEDICSKTHIEPDPSTAADKSSALIDSGLVDPCELLTNIEAQINKAKDEALSRKDIMNRIERWLSACEEENWLEGFSLNQSHYSGGRGAHINLKRAERARILVNKIPGMVENLISKTLSWEKEKKKLFLYDGARLVSILEDYKVARQQKEEEKRRARDQKKLQNMQLAEKESIYGSRPSPRRSTSFKSVSEYHSNGNGSVTPSPRRKSVGGPNSDLLTPRSYSGHQNGYFKGTRRLSTGPLNFVAIAKEDIMSFSSVCGSDPESPPKA
ncbi:PREDICTED: 65-kDa microtubule-associated protein 6-like [Ipomoea nil]|uniref:65-kDa microtubule-associated protein 6-like n=1 Tax=Ipomoea nil TaxID=35883 RepID=UPI00090167CA|nr:PREDICTED: 65-kDa microtubule-associated protein 6-like [Ipomoea nil]